MAIEKLVQLAFDWSLLTEDDLDTVLTWSTMLRPLRHIKGLIGKSLGEVVGNMAGL